VARRAFVICLNRVKECALYFFYYGRIDAVGRHRPGLSLGGHDEHEQTLNPVAPTLKMDGFESNDGVILVSRPIARMFLIPAFRRQTF